MRAPRTFTIVAQDPSVRVRGRILTARVALPPERLAPGPRGHRAYVIDYDASTGVLYAPAGATNRTVLTNRAILSDPTFHARNAFAITMRILVRFEHALGRRVSWSFDSHQIKIAPHALREANAYYSKREEALLFGYFPAATERGTVFTCLSHDIVAHEVAHALLDGLRERYSEASGPDQAAFHEGFADTVAALSVFSLPEVAGVALPKSPGPKGWRLRESILLTIGKQIGRELSDSLARSLRRPTHLAASTRLMASGEFQPPHRRGQILSAALLRAFIDAWSEEARPYRTGDRRDRAKVVNLGAAIADRLLTVAIRAIDYTPPVDIRFSDYLSALLTASHDMEPNPLSVRLRPALRRAFRAFGITPAASDGPEAGVWRTPCASFIYQGINADSLQRDANEVFRFLWENRRRMGLSEHAYTRVLSVRPCTRLGGDGLVRRQTVAEYVQVLPLTARELGRFRRVARPAGMPAGQQVTLYGGGALLFDEYGAVRHHIHNPISDAKRQSERLDYLWRSGYFTSEERTA